MDALNFGYNNVIQEQLQNNQNNLNNPNIASPFGSRITTEDVIFVSIMLIVALMIVFAQRPVVGPAVDSMAYDLTHNAVTDFIMSGVSSSYVLSKKADELRSAISQIKTPAETSDKIVILQKQIKSDIKKIVYAHGELTDPMLDALSPDFMRSVIAYSIASRLQRLLKSEPIGLHNLNAVEFLHGASNIVSCSNSSNSNNTDPDTILAALQLTTVSLSMIRGVDAYSKRDLINDIVKHRLGNGRSEPNEQNALNMDLEFRTMHDIIKNVLDDTQRAIDGECSIMVCDTAKSSRLSKLSRSKIVHIDQNRLVAEFMLGFESAWLVGGAPIAETNIIHLRSAANDFGVLYQIYGSFVSYYADIVKCKPNYVSVVGLKKSYAEFYDRVRLFVQKATELSIMTDALKHIINYMSDCVTLAKSIIIKNAKPSKKAYNDDDNDDADIREKESEESNNETDVESEESEESNSETDVESEESDDTD